MTLNGGDAISGDRGGDTFSPANAYGDGHDGGGSDFCGGGSGDGEDFDGDEGVEMAPDPETDS